MCSNIKQHDEKSWLIASVKMKMEASCYNKFKVIAGTKKNFGFNQFPTIKWLTQQKTNA